MGGERGGARGEISTGAKEGIQGHIMAMGHEPHNYMPFYVQVDDLQKYLDKAEELGGKMMIPPTEIPGGMGSFAWLRDPEGAMVGIFRPPQG